MNNEQELLKLLLPEYLIEYFEGKRKEFTVPLHFVGSDFQKSVWEVLMKTPFW